MKISFIIALTLTSFQAMAATTGAKILVCTAETGKFGMSTQSTDLYVSDLKMKDEDLVNKTNAHGRVSMEYNAQLNQFTGSGEDGCVQVEYITEINSKGNTVLIEDADGTQTIFPCQWLN